MADIKISLKNGRGDSSPGTVLFISNKILVPLSLIYMDFHLNLTVLYFIASWDRCHTRGRRRLLNPEHLVVLIAGPIVHGSCRNFQCFTGFFIVYFTVFLAFHV